MKYSIFLIFLLLNLSVFSQFKIGSNNKSFSSNVFLEIESTSGKKVVVSKDSAKVGIGTNTPTETLEIIGTIKIKDGTQGYGKILKSDSNGKASWQNQTNTFDSTTSSNGLTQNGKELKLGGALTGATTITTSSSNTLSLSGLSTGAATDSVLVADPSSGEIKRISVSSLIQSKQAWFSTSTNKGAQSNTDSVYLMGKVGIGTSTPNKSSILDLTSSNKGFLPPRISLTATNDITTIATPATGLFIFNTATAGTAPNNVTPGFYYFDGLKWQRIINQVPDATVDFDSINPNTGTPTFTPNFPASSDYIYVSKVDGNQWAWNGSTYVTYVAPSATAWNLNGGTSDAGSNKTTAIYRTGAVGIGTNTTPDASALLDINSTTKGFLPPRMTKTQRDAIASPASGLLIYCTNCTANGTGCLNQNIGTTTAPSWECVGSTSSPSVATECTVAGGGFNGSYIGGIATSGAYYVVKISNNSFASATLALGVADLVLSGASSGLTVSSVSLTAGGASVTSVTLGSGANQYLYYNLTGTPASTGNLVGTWSKLSLSCVNTKAISGISAALNSNYCTNSNLNGNYISGIAMASTNTYTVTLTNTSAAALNGLPAPTTSNLGLTWSGTGTLSVASVSPSATFNLAAGASQTITYTLSGTPTGTGTLNTNWTYGDLTCSKTKTIATLIASIDTNFCNNSAFLGSYVSGVAMASSNKYTITLTNTSSVAINGLPAPTTSNLGLAWSGTGSLSITSVSPSATFNLAAGASQTITYTFSGTPTSSNYLTTTWNYAGISCVKTKLIALGDATFPTPQLNQYVFSVNDAGIPLNSQGTLATGTILQMPYTGGFGSYIAYNSPFVSIPAQYCEDGASDWTFGYSYSSGTFAASGNIAVTLITKKAGVTTAWTAKRVSSVTTINFNCISAPWVVNTNSYSNTIGIDEGGDAIRGAIAQGGNTSGAAYDAAVVNQLVPITLTEYNKVLAIVPGASRRGIDAHSSGGLGTTDGVMAPNGSSFLSLTTNSYVAAVSFTTYTSFPAGNIIVTASPSQTGATVCLTSTTANVSWTGGVTRYFAVKRPTTHCGTNTFLGRTSTGSTLGAGGVATGSTSYSQVLNNCGASKSTTLGWTESLQVITSTQKSW